VTDGVLVTMLTVAGSVLVAFITTRLRRPKDKNDFIDSAFTAQELVMKRQAEEIAGLKSDLLNVKTELSNTRAELSQYKK
jgi:hypothetical protein